MDEFQKLDLLLLALKSTESILSLVTHKTGEFLWISDLGLRIRYVSPSSEQILGWTVQEILRLKPGQIFPPKSATEFVAMGNKIKREVENGTLMPEMFDKTGELVLIRKDKTTFISEWTMTVLFDESGIPFGMKGTVRNIDRLKKLESAVADTESRMKAIYADLEHSERKFSDLVNLIPAGVFELALDGTILYGNDRFFDILGYAKEEIPVGMANLLDFIPDRERVRLLAHMKAVPASKKPEQNDYWIFTKSGTQRKLQTITTPIKGGNRVFGIRGVCLDVTERVIMERERERIERLEALGNLAGGIAHDYNNILMGILGNLSLAKLDAGGNEDIEKAIGDAEKSVFRARDLTSQLLLFSRSEDDLKKTGSIESVIQATLTALPKDKMVRLEPGKGNESREVKYDEVSLKQAFTNILTNSFALSGSNSPLCVKTETVTEAESSEFLPTPGTWIKVEFREDREQGTVLSVFNPEIRSGGSKSGLDLAIAHYIVKRHGGIIVPDADRKSPIIVSVYLPEAGSKGPVQIPRKEPKIIFVDDDLAVRATIHDFALHASLNLDSAQNRDEAVALFTSSLESGEPYTLAIIDLAIEQDRDGIELFRELERLDPRVKGIITSGRTDDPVFRNWSIYGFKAALPKPYRQETFESTVKSVSA